MNYRIFFRFTGIFTVYLVGILLASLYPLYKYAGDAAVTGAYINTAFFYVMTLLAFVFVARAADKKGMMLNAFLGGIVLKILVAMIYLFFSIRKFPGHEIEFAITFFAAYLICTGFEVYYILHNLRQN